jgi:catechol 2,3-dioxygenase-like lactoylglutathione lyase family enzyme
VLQDAAFVGFIPVADLLRARDFYVSVLGLALESEDPYAVVLDANGTSLRLTQVPELRPQPFTIAGWKVVDIESEVNALGRRGVIFNRYEGMGQDDRAIWTTPSGDKVAWFTDPDGNTLSLTTFSKHR